MSCSLDEKCEPEAVFPMWRIPAAWPQEIRIGLGILALPFVGRGGGDCVRILGSLAVLLVVIVLAGSLYQFRASATDRERYPPPGQILDVDGLALHLDCRGTGEPTLVLEAGLTSGSVTWMLVHDALAETTRVCAYDRPGMDWSEPLGRTANAAEVASRLRRVLEVGGVEGPIVLLGMSAGGVYVREFHRAWPEDIVGMVFVDSSHEQQGHRLPGTDRPDATTEAVSLCARVQPFGVIRAFSLMAPLLDSFNIPAQVRDVIEANISQSHSCASIQAELESFDGEVTDESPPSSLGDLPLLVLSRGKYPEASEDLGITLAMATEGRRVWDELQKELTALSSRGRRVIATESGHVIQFGQPQLLIDEVTRLILEIRAGDHRGGDGTSFKGFS
jgi:pimeloyl-ACP methyl ester carboxylesterase